ncbi:MAG: phage portal protein [Anaerolineae bacterium]|nr:phage portal protein [Anaerolineae bacterium]
MEQYKNLKPGFYLQVGDSIKSVKSVPGETLEALLLGRSGKPTLELLAGSVGWVFTALETRAEMIKQIPVVWRKDDRDSDNPPHPMKLRSLLCQTDTALQTYGQAFWYKERYMSGKIRVHWLDPLSITCDMLTIDEYGEYTQYFRILQNGQQKTLSADDVIHFMRPGLREMEPGTSAAAASRLAAEVLQGSTTAVSSTFGNNALPIFLIHVPAGTQREDRESFVEKFLRIANPKKYGSVERRAVGVPDGVSITKLSFSPAELALDSVEESKRLEILAAHGVPESVLISNAANHAVKEDDTVTFIMRMASRLKDIADVLADDPDFAGWELVLQIQKMPAMQMRNLAMVEALALATGQPFITGDEARDYLDLEPLGLGIAMATLDMGMATEIAGDDLAAELWQEEANAKEAEMTKLHKFIKGGTYKKRPFQSDILTDAEIQAEMTKNAKREKVQNLGEQYADAILGLIERAIDNDVSAADMTQEWRKLAIQSHMKSFKRGLGIAADEELLPVEQEKFNKLMAIEYESIDNAVAELFDAKSVQAQK